METKKQTAVEWLVEQLEQHHVKIDIKNTVIFDQAKEKERDQIVEAYRDGRTDQQTRVPKYYNRSSAIYYTSTYE
jgi:hypothetical protein